MLIEINVFSLSGKTSIGVGGAGGLGAEIAMALSEAGANVRICRWQYWMPHWLKKNQPDYELVY